MRDTPVSKTLYQKMSVSTLKAFMFILFPVAILGQILVVYEKMKEGIWNAGMFGLPNLAVQLCCIATIGIMTVGMFSCRNELQSRKERGSI